MVGGYSCKWDVSPFYLSSINRGQDWAPPSQTVGQCQENDTKELTLPCAETLLDRFESESLIPDGWAISRPFCCSTNISCRLSALIKPLPLENLKPKEAKMEAIKWELGTARLMKWASVRRNVCQVRGPEGGATGFPLKKQVAESKTWGFSNWVSFRLPGELAANTGLHCGSWGGEKIAEQDVDLSLREQN